MGFRYVWFRVWYEFRRKTGWLKRQFPTSPPLIALPDLENWKMQGQAWPWPEREKIDFPINPNPALKEKAESILKGELSLFQSFPFYFQNRNDWTRNPETGFQYDVNLHWTQIPDLSPEAGDIKYVWERSRFTHFHSIIRYDYHFDLDHAEWVFSEIESWIKANPINCGPNYRCSQEISLRVFNWLGALVFYKNSPALTEARWNLFIKHLYWQMHHVRQNIHFSRIAVRNNHAITETLALYIFGTLFPTLPEAAEWKRNGKKWFEQEMTYQVYVDGSFLQFSMNYHRVLVQLVTLAIRFADIHHDLFSGEVYERAFASLRFLKSFQDPGSHQLPNYGANDGALFFQFTDLPFRDYSPQLAALEAALCGTKPDDENAQWFGSAIEPYFQKEKEKPTSVKIFTDGGYASIREPQTLTFFRCGRFKDRPSQADNLHVDIWHNGQNIFRDGGSFKYNASEADMRYFFGSSSHNLVMINGQDQMKKGPRFVFTHWSQARFFRAGEDELGWTLLGEIEAFSHIKKGIRHKRKLWKSKTGAHWEIEDHISGISGSDFELLWHPSPGAIDTFDLKVIDANGQMIKAREEMGWYSGLYGMKEESPFFVFSSRQPYFKTTIIEKTAI